MKINGKRFFSFLASLILFLGIASYAYSQSCDTSCNSGDVDCLSKVISDCSSKVSQLQSQANTLKNQIAQFDAQIKLTALKISQTEEKILLLGGRIEQLEESLQSLSKAFGERVVETYKMSKFESNFFYIFTAPGIDQAVSRYHYLKKIQEADRNLLDRLEKAQTTYIGEKEDQEELQKQLELQRKQLDSQKAAKANLLAVTRNDEKRYQQLLSRARAEYEAIAGKGTETEAGTVSEGQKIADVARWSEWKAGRESNTCNSSGAHVHFIVRKPGGVTDNPFSYLQSGISYDNCSGSYCGSSDGDPFNPGGSWMWPVSSKIIFSQGYGSTWAVRNTWVSRIYSFHNGIDVTSDSSGVIKAVKSGTLYQGSYNVGCLLKYVRVDHADSDLDTLYLHVDY
jgi:peptidoglycan hydrolase CwlO-like protein